MAHFTCLAAARHARAARRRLGRRGRRAAGRAGAARHRRRAGARRPSPVACRLLGLGAERDPLRAGRRPGPDARGRARRALARHDGPAIVCAQAGEINTGAFDPLAEIVDACRARGAWCHVDGAFGLWAAASPTRRAPGRRRRAGGLLGDRRPQVAQRALRLRHRRRGRRAGAPRGDDVDRRLHPRPRRRRPVGLRLDARVLAPRARRPRLRRAALPGPRRRRRPRRPLLRPRGADGGAPGGAATASRCSTTSC